MPYYCTIEYVKTLLPTSLTIGTASQTQPTLQVTGGRETVTETRARELIALASQLIDSRLSPVYVAPLRKMKTMDTEITGRCSNGTNTIYVRDGGIFSVGCQIRLSSRKGGDSFTVTKLYDDVPNTGKIEVTPALSRTYEVSGGWLASIVDYPPPIPLICARLTVSMIIDRMFVSDQSPDASKYGLSQKDLAGADLDAVMQGVVRLHGQEHQGQRFIRNSLRNAVATPAANFQPGGMK